MPTKNYSNILFLSYLPLVFLAKLIRYTILKGSTVDQGIGHYYIVPILYGKPHFYVMGLGTIGVDTKNAATDNAIYLFKLFNWFSCQTYEQFEIAISVVFNIIFMYLIYHFIKKNRIVTLNQYLFLALFVGVANIYTFVLSKEPIQMLYFMIIFFILKSSMGIRQKWIGCFLAILLIIVTTRTYYLLMGMFAILFPLLYPRINKMSKGYFFITFLLFLIIFVGVFDVFLHVVQILRPEEYEEIIRVRLRNDEQVPTVISPWIPTPNIEMFAANYLLTALRMLFPLELIRLGVKYIPFVVFQVIVTSIFIKSLKNYNNIPSLKQLVTSLYWGFFFCSATFEPDFGSWVRHESVTLPFIIFILYDNNKLLSHKKNFGQIKYTYENFR